MEIPTQLIVFSIPSLVLIAVMRYVRKASWRESFSSVGWRWSNPVYYLWALLITVVIGVLAYFSIKSIPVELMKSDRINITQYSGTPKTVLGFLVIFINQAIFTTLGEEMFFRGWLGGWLNRRLGFFWGNLIQSFVFLLPHLMLLTVGVGFWPIFIPQFVAGWLQGWLRYRSGSILPGWFSHTLTNTLSAWTSL